MNYKLDALRSPHDNRDFIVEAVYPKPSFPVSIDYRDQLFAVRDQGWQGSCVAHAGACMKEWQELHDAGIYDHISPQFIYNLREDPSESGMYARDLMRILKNIGSVEEFNFPYGTKGQPDLAMIEKAKRFVIDHYASINTINGLKDALYKNGVCMIIVPVYHYEGAIWKQTDVHKDLLGAHAMSVVGYNSKGFIIRNSWGEDWGDGGYCIFPYEDWGWQWEIWTSIDDLTLDYEPDKIKNLWFKISNWIVNNKGTLLYFIPVAIFLGYVLYHELL